MPENRDDPSSRTISLRVVSFPTQSRKPAEDPILFIAGGPGQGAASIAAIVMRLIKGIDRDRTTILVDVRGTGASGPLNCEDTGRVIRGARNEAFDRCLQELSARADLRHYSTADVVADLDDVRRALDIEQLNLVGVSYGTRVAVQYLFQYPAHVRTVVLRGADPLNGKTFLDADRAADRALEAVISDCEKDRSCAMAFPALRHEAGGVARTFTDHARAIEVTDPKTSARKTIIADYALYHDLLYAFMLDETGRREVPRIIHRLAAGGTKGLASMAVRELSDYDAIAAGVYYSVTCAEDDPRLTEDERKEIAMMERRAAEPDDRCNVWPRPSPLPPPLVPRHVDVPVLIVSGADDPATPPAGAAALASKLGATHLVIPAGSHTPLFPGCVSRLVREFIGAASGARTDGRCLKGMDHLPFITTR